MQKEQFNNLLENPDLLNENTLSGLKSLVEKFPYFQSGWMLYIKNLKEINSPDYGIMLKKAAIIVPDRKLLFLFLSNHTPKQKTTQETEKLIQPYLLENEGESGKENSLIDKFLLSGPGKIEGKTNTKNHDSQEVKDSILIKSVSESDEIITETLASIYFEQKKFDRAIDAYEKLSLKNPEKSVYFATRIEEIEKLKEL